jgi:hypothetical protein
MVRRQISSSRFHNNPRASSLALLLLLCMGMSARPNTGQERSGNPAPISPADLPRFTGGNPPYADTNYHDGRFRPAVGVRNIQVLRGNRKHPEQLYDMSKMPAYPDAGFDGVGFTYNHAPMLCYWRDTFWLEYLSCPVHENRDLGHSLLTWSRDGLNWARPEVIFPTKKFRDKKDNVEKYSICHQRMGFYVAPNGRLLVTDWNTYSGVWTPIAVVEDGGNKVLRLQDRDPYDYAKAVRVFPETTKAQISFRVRPRQEDAGDLEIEVLNYKGQRPVRIQIAGGVIRAGDGAAMKQIGMYSAGQWLQFALAADT